MKRGAASSTIGALVALLLPSPPPRRPPPPDRRLAPGHQHPGRLGAAQGRRSTPKGSPTTYRFEYSRRQAQLRRRGRNPTVSSAGLGHDRTPPGPRSRASAQHHLPLPPGRDQLLGLRPSAEATFDNHRRASASSPGDEASSARAIADGGGAGDPGRLPSLPAATSTSASDRGGEFEGQPGVPSPTATCATSTSNCPPGLIVNPSAPRQCTPAEFQHSAHLALRSKPLGRELPGPTQVGTVELEPASAAAQRAASASSTSTPPPGVPAQLGFAPYGVADRPRRRDLPEAADGTYGLDPAARNFPQSLDLSGARPDRSGAPLGRLPRRRARQLPERGRAQLPLGQMLGRQPQRLARRLPT